MLHVRSSMFLSLIFATFSVFDQSSNEHAPEHSIGFNMDKSPLAAIPLLEGQQDLMDGTLSIPDNVNIFDEKTDEKEEEDKVIINSSEIVFPWQVNPIFVSAGGDRLCREHTQIYLRDLKKWQKWSLQMWDASGKLGSGLFSGNGNQLGDFDSCLLVNGPKGITPHYCLAAIDLSVSDEAPPIIRDVVNKIQGENFVRSTRNDPGHFVPRFTTLGWGLCVPSSCKKDAIESGLENTLAPLNSTPGLVIHAGIPKYSCYQPAQSLPLSTILVLCFYCAVILTAISATILDNGKNSNLPTQGWGNRLLMAFSLKRGVKELFSTNIDEFPCIHGIRALFTIILFLAHKLVPLASILYTNRVYLTKLSNSTLSSILRASNIYTDSFLLLSAVLTSYNLTKEIVTKGSINWPTRLLTRYIRLTPPLLALVLYYAAVMEHTGSGPQWSTAVVSNADLCKNGFWKNLFYIQNFFPFEEMCGTHTHQLALDMQMFLLAPALVYILHCEKILGCILFLAIGAASTALRFYIIYNNHLSLYIHHGVTVTDLYRAANLSYGQTTHRIVPYLLGIALGYFLYKSRKTVHLTPKGAVLGWGLSIFCGLYSVFSQAHLAMPNHNYNAMDAGVYAALSPITSAFSLSWLILACSTGHADPLEQVLGSRALLLISRLSYSIYLVQFAVFFYNIGSTRSTQTMSLLETVTFLEVVMVGTAAIVLTLLFDLPMQEIKNVILSGSRKNSKEA